MLCMPSKDPETRKAIAARYYTRNRESLRDRARAYKAKAPEKHKAARRASHLRHKYQMTLAEWDALFASQNHVCAVCKSPEHRGRGWHVDHDHESGRVRGILCVRCNVAIGMLGDTYESARAALANVLLYLHPSRCGDGNP